MFGILLSETDSFEPVPVCGATDEAKQCGSSRETVGLLEHHLSNQRPTKKAAELLRGLAKSKHNPELAEGLDGAWRREQIAAIIRESFRD